MKWLGALLVMVSSIGYSQRLLERQKQHCDILQSFVSICELLAGKIRYERRPMEEVFGDFKKKNYGSAGRVLEVIGDRLFNGTAESLESAWNLAFIQEQKQLMLTVEELNMVLDIGKNLGYLDVEAQVLHLKSCKIQLEKHLEKLRQEVYGKRKVYNYLGVAVGVMVVLILI